MKIASRLLAFVVFSLFSLIVTDIQAQQRHALSLDDAINTALKRGEEVEIASGGVRAAEGAVESATSGLLPQVAASAVYTRTLKSQYSNSTPTGDIDSVTRKIIYFFSLLPFGKENQWNAVLSASQNIFTGGRLTAQREAALARRRSADIDLTAAEAQLALSVTQSYYDAELADTLVHIAEDALAQAEDIYKQTQLAFEVGAKAEFDALRAKVARDNQVPFLLQSQNDRSQAYYRLKQLLNLPLEDSLMLTTPVVDSIARFAMASDTSEAQRASVRQAKENLTASAATVRMAEAAHWPQISISSAYAPVAYPSGVFPNSNDWYANWTAQLNISLPLYTGGNISGNIEQARGAFEQAQGRLQQAREAAVLDAKSSTDALATATANLKATSSTAAEASRAYDIARVRFTQGISTQIELDDSRIQEEQARANWARAVRNYQVARAKLSLLKDLPVTPQFGMPAGVPQQGMQQMPQGSSQSFTSPSGAAGSQMSAPQVQ